MPLRYRVENEPESIQELELAAREKYLEGLELMVSGQPGGGIYLMGYAAEMLLKTAFFLFEGARPADLVLPRLAPALHLAQTLIPDVNHETYHSLRFWALLLIERRCQQNRPLPDEVEARLRQGTRRLHQNWYVAMRYHADRSDRLEMRSVDDDVTWLEENHPALWR